MNLDIERAAFARWFDGLAAKEIASPRSIGCMAYEERARIAEKHEAELVAALRLCYEHCRLYHPEVVRNNVGDAVRAVLANYLDEVVA